MKKGNIYLLRHEQRERSVDFNTSLTDIGLHNSATTLCSKLENLNIDVIYCSPFLRTLQTIRPFCEKTGKQINIEWALAESIDSDTRIIPEFQHIMNKKYRSGYQINETLSGLIMPSQINRKLITQFLDMLEKQDPSLNILLVTHLPVINTMISIKTGEDIDIYYHRPAGSISLLNDQIL